MKKNGKPNISDYLVKGSKQSSMRLVLFICTITACLIAGVSIVLSFILLLVGKIPLDIGAISILVGLLVGAPTAGKVGQAFTEAKNPEQEPKKDE